MCERVSLSIKHANNYYEVEDLINRLLVIRMSPEVEFTARVRFDLYPESVSGRTEVVYSPARPNHRVEGFEHFFISQLDFIGFNLLKPGGSVTANAHGTITSEMISSLKNGGKWLVYAGPQRLIGEINNIEWLVPH